MISLHIQVINIPIIQNNKICLSLLLPYFYKYVKKDPCYFFIKLSKYVVPTTKNITSKISFFGKNSKEDSII